MNKLIYRLFAAFTVLSMMTLGLMLAGCSGGGSSSGAVSTEVVSGTAANGEPLSGQVSIKDSSIPPQQKSTVIGSDGSFAIDVAGMTAPFVLQAKGNVGGTEYKMHSFANGKGTANINPLSNIIVASAAGDDNPDDVFDKADHDKCHRIKNNLEQTVSILLAKLQPLLKHYNAERNHPITAHYIANHLDMDEMFDNVKITVSKGIITIINKKTNAVIFTGKISDIAKGIFDGGAIPSAPATPTGVAAVGGTDQVTLTWTPVSSATTYNVYYSTTTGVTKTNGTKITSVNTPYVKTGLTAGTSYFFIVTAIIGVEESADSTQVSAVTASTPPVATIPAAPAAVIATGGTSQVTLSWGAVNTATSYNVYYATTSGVTMANGTKIANATNPTVQTGLTAATTYYYVVSAVNSIGEGTASVQVAATTLAVIPNPTAPVAPSGVTATGGATQATINWTAVSGAASYNVYWSATTGVTITNGTKVSGVSSPYVKTGLLAGTSYYFIVTAANNVGESAASTQATATTSAAVPVVPAAPTGVTATGGATQISISWTAVPGATSYNAYYSTSSGVTTANGTKITNAISPAVKTGLAAGTTYYVIVTAVNSTGEGAASAQASAATDAAASTCGSCHAIPPDLGAHSFHTSYSCATCHGTGYSSTTVNAATHMNGVKDVTISIWIPATRSCAVQCHSARAW